MEGSEFETRLCKLNDAPRTLVEMKNHFTGHAVGTDRVTARTGQQPAPTSLPHNRYILLVLS